MLTPSHTLKIRPHHLERLALIYVRQSTGIQVREHPASAARQYDLARRARDLGWPPERILVIDEDQGRSGASAAGRDGFQYIVGQVGLGRGDDLAVDHQGGGAVVVKGGDPQDGGHAILVLARSSCPRPDP